MNRIVLDVKNISKRYRLGIISRKTLREDLNYAWSRLIGKEDPNYIVDSNDNYKSKKKKFSWALNNISFQINQGEVVGIIGRNGAGKSTLLKILSRITAPTKGEVCIKGRIASLLEVGTGFHPELTGKENIFLNGAILGMTKKEVKNKLDEIIEFSGVNKYIDTPVKRYSSGMHVRLAFSVAAHLEPDILLIDEVLSVGDAEFQKKCIGKMDNVARQGRTVLFVSHRLNAVRTLCTRGIVLNEGELVHDGSINGAIKFYTNYFSKPDNTIKNFNMTQNGLSLKTISVSESNITSGGSFYLEFSFSKNDDIDYECGITFHLTDDFGNLVFTGSTLKSNKSFKMLNGNIKAKCTIPKNLMNEGFYHINRLLFIKNSGTVLFEVRECFSFKILPKKRGYGWIGEKEEGIVSPSLDWNLKIKNN